MQEIKEKVGEQIVRRVTINTILQPKEELRTKLWLEDPYQHLQCVLTMSDGMNIRVKTPTVNPFLWFSYRAVWNRDRIYGIVHKAYELEIETPPLNPDMAVVLAQQAYLDNIDHRKNCYLGITTGLMFNSPAELAQNILTFKCKASDWRIGLRRHKQIVHYLVRVSCTATNTFYRGIDAVWQQPLSQLVLMEEALNEDPRAFLFRPVFRDVFPKARALAEDTRLDSEWTKFNGTSKVVATYRKFVSLQQRFKCLYFDPAQFFGDNEKEMAELAGTQVVRISLHNQARFYLETTWEIQRSICNSIAKLLQRPRWTESKSSAHRFNRDYLGPDQRIAVIGGETEPFFYLAGAPGTGKSECIKHWRTKGSEVLMLAPTGCAAAVVSSRCGHPAGTIDYLLTKLQSYPLNKHPWLKHTRIIVDEAVMVGAEKMEKLLHFIAEYCPKVRNTNLCGDPDQLKSIEFGAPFLDIIDSGVVPGHKLKYIHRLQGADAASIYRNSQRVLVGDSKFETNAAFERIETLDDNGVRELLKKYGNRVTFTAYHRATIDSLNNDLTSGADRERFSKEGIKVGQRIVFRENKYSSETSGQMATLVVANGMTGVVKDIRDIISNKTDVAVTDTATQLFPNARCRRLILDSNCGLREIDLTGIPAHTIENADARSIYTFQGGENEVVVVILEERMSRPELYVALTRGKVKVYCVGKDWLLEHILSKPIEPRVSEIGEMLRRKLELRTLPGAAKAA